MNLHDETLDIQIGYVTNIAYYLHKIKHKTNNI